jgi:hypothetical protein
MLRIKEKWKKNPLSHPQIQRKLNQGTFSA